MLQIDDTMQNDLPTTAIKKRPLTMGYGSIEPVAEYSFFLWNHYSERCIGHTQACFESVCGCDADVRVDSWIERGTTISPHYDSLLAKLMVYAPDRLQAAKKMSAALAEARVGPRCLHASIITILTVELPFPASFFFTSP